jgi:hypothetical protein
MKIKIYVKSRSFTTIMNHFIGFNNKRAKIVI